ncbi:amino acid ABC transporter substrate-binding protein [Lampropedia aestuarii]|uniref:Amino acid ABC transporter substrate-binding protein n=1 Tax=Lampropedia aestuarii TaxID=2562762 RepID=A0A4S5BM95_9BURK|nr:ABC transporter substrate-binding protein [Lampropedia aestuarii]THJ33399.1 amino acid ABC transporter substrate-binding protein [Lampropedia aestuarii]
MNKRNFLSLCAGAALLGTLHIAAAQEAIRIGAVLPLTGPSATIGEDMRRGLQLGVERVNANGGVMGKQLALIVEDSANNPTTALTAARKLATVDKVPVVLGEFSSSITLPVAQYLVKEGVVHMNIGSSSTKVRDLGDSAFNLIGLEDAGNRFAAQDVYAMGLRNVAVITPNNAYGQGVSHGFKEEFEKLGGKVAGQILYTGGQSSYRRELQQLARAKPDAYLYSSYGHEAAIINREAKELGLRSQPWYAYIMSMSVSDTPADIAEGQVGMELGASKGELGQAYAQAYNTAFKEGFASVFNGYAYDGVVLIGAAMNQAAGSSAADVQKGLKAVSEQGFTGVTGPIHFDAKGQRTDPPYDKLKLENGKLIPR